MKALNVAAAAAMVLACALVSGCDDTGSDAPQTYQLSMTDFGCTHHATQDRITQLDADGDKAAAINYARQSLATGECVYIDKGTTVYVDDMEMFNGLDKVHVQGNPDDYWIDSSVVKPVDASSATPKAPSVAAVSAVSPSAARASIGMQMIGCQSLKTFKRVMALYKNNEEDRHAEEIQNDLDSGECVVLNQGDRVAIVASIGITNTRVQPEGDPNSYWTFWSVVDQR